MIPLTVNDLRGADLKSHKPQPANVSLVLWLDQPMQARERLHQFIDDQLAVSGEGKRVFITDLCRHQPQIPDVIEKAGRPHAPHDRDLVLEYPDASEDASLDLSPKRRDSIKASKLLFRVDT